MSDERLMERVDEDDDNNGCSSTSEKKGSKNATLTHETFFFRSTVETTFIFLHQTHQRWGATGVAIFATGLQP